MKIVFLCACLEPEKDGVGDYTRKLSNELVNSGHTVSAIAINDKYCKTLVEENYPEKLNFSILRIPSVWVNDTRFESARKWIISFNPDWVSLQFVIYAYHSKGLPFKLARSLKNLGKSFNWHIMFHEIWIGVSPTSQIKDKMIGFVQKKIIVSIVRYVEPKIITTSNILYQLMLNSININSTILPMFSNIDIAPKNDILTFQFLKSIGLNSVRELDGWEIIGIFGQLHPEANLEQILNQRLFESKKTKVKLAFVAFGRIGEKGMMEFKRLEILFNQKIKFLDFGEQSQENVSNLMQLINIGISNTQLSYIGKSGVYAAMKLHNINVIIPDDQKFPQYDEEIRRYHAETISQPPINWNVLMVAKNMINLLSSTNVMGG